MVDTVAVHPRTLLCLLDLNRGLLNRLPHRGNGGAVVSCGLNSLLQSASGISVEADENVYLYAGTRMTIRGDSGIYLTGDVYVNGTLLQVSSS